MVNTTNGLNPQVKSLTIHFVKISQKIIYHHPKLRLLSMGNIHLQTGREVLGEHHTPKFLCLLSSLHLESDNLCNYAFFPTVYCLYTVLSKPWGTASKFMKSAKKGT